MNALIESTQELLRFAIAERDAFYDCSTDAEGNLNDPGDQAELERMDAMIDRARAALSDCANDREPPPVNLMFSTGHKDPFNFTASDRRFFVSYPAPPSVAVPEGLKSKVMELCSAVENGEDLPPVKYALKCGRLINEVKDMLTAAPSPDHIADAGKVVQPCRHCGEDPQAMHEHNNTMLPVIYWCECLSTAHMDYMRLEQWNEYHATPSVPENEIKAQALEEYADQLDAVFANAQEAGATDCPAWHAGQFAKDARKQAARLRTAGDEGEGV